VIAALFEQMVSLEVAAGVEAPDPSGDGEVPAGEVSTRKREPVRATGRPQLQLGSGVPSPVDAA